MFTASLDGETRQLMVLDYEDGRSRTWKIYSYLDGKLCAAGEFPYADYHAEEKDGRWIYSALKRVYPLQNDNDTLSFVPSPSKSIKTSGSRGRACHSYRYGPLTVISTVLPAENTSDTISVTGVREVYGCEYVLDIQNLKDGKEVQEQEVIPFRSGNRCRRCYHCWKRLRKIGRCK